METFTELNCAFSLRRDTPEDVIDTLLFMPVCRKDLKCFALFLIRDRGCIHGFLKAHWGAPQGGNI
jgi:hypothetical protein